MKVNKQDELSVKRNNTKITRRSSVQEASLHVLSRYTRDSIILGKNVNITLPKQTDTTMQLPNILQIPRLLTMMSGTRQCSPRRHLIVFTITKVAVDILEVDRAAGTTVEEVAAIKVEVVETTTVAQPITIKLVITNR